MATFICLIIMLPAVGELEGKVALITGGAGSIGAATARLFASEGARVVVSDVDERVLAVGEEVGFGVVADAADSDAVRGAVATAVERFGGLDIAFANAGAFGVVSDIAGYPEDVFDHVMRVNVRGPFLLCKHALAAMRDGGALIINSSVVGLTSDAGIVAYATSKHAVVGLMRTAAKEAAARGIRVNTIHPGPVDNAFQHAIEVTATGKSEADAAQVFEGMIPLRRHATPEEIARAVLFLATGGFVTGATLAVDGGMSI
jgi:NAD(P)-dependent dehydrogenase (short-subunit alcohol dehydrogenase family)